MNGAAMAVQKLHMTIVKAKFHDASWFRDASNQIAYWNLALID